MNKELFFNMFDNYDNFKVIIYKKEEIISMFNINMGGIEDYDDEIIVRGMDNSFIILIGDPEVIINDDLEKEFIFHEGEIEVGIIFY